MGGRSPDATDWAAYATRTTSHAYTTARVATDILKQREIHPDMDPKKFNVRESRHSPANPKSTPVIVFLDVTGSMGVVALEIAKHGLGTLIKEILDRKPVSDPHIAFGGIGDVYSDRAPLQLSQFEADMTMLDQLEKLWVEGSGGANNSESYCLAWHVAAFHTSTDAYEKDGRKGFLFTIGDEEVPPDLTSAQLFNVYGHGDEVVLTNAELLAKVSQQYHVFHIVAEQGSHMRARPAPVLASWRELLGQRVILMNDYSKLAEIVVSTMQVVAGDDKTKVAASWGGGTSMTVARALTDLPGGVAVKKDKELVRF